jgi:hypothetical protein
MFIPRLPWYSAGEFGLILTVIEYLTPGNNSIVSKQSLKELSDDIKVTWVKVVVVVVVEGIPDDIRVLVVLHELMVGVGLLVGLHDALVPARVEREARGWLATQLRYVASEAVHVAVADHDARVVAHVASVALELLGILAVAELITLLEVLEAGACLEEVVVHFASHRFRILELKIV